MREDWGTCLITHGLKEAPVLEILDKAGDDWEDNDLVTKGIVGEDSSLVSLGRFGEDVVKARHQNTLLNCGFLHVRELLHPHDALLDMVPHGEVTQLFPVGGVAPGLRVPVEKRDCATKVASGEPGQGVCRMEGPGGGGRGGPTECWPALHPVEEVSLVRVDRYEKQVAPHRNLLLEILPVRACAVVQWSE